METAGVGASPPPTPSFPSPQQPDAAPPQPPATQSPPPSADSGRGRTTDTTA